MTGVTANLDDLLLAFEYVNAGDGVDNAAYWCRATGKIHYSSKFGPEEEPLPDDIADETRYVSIPHKSDLGLGTRLVQRFVNACLPDDADEVEAIFRRRGAYARFKDLLERRAVLQEWFAFEAASVVEALREWCEDNEIGISA